MHYNITDLLTLTLFVDWDLTSDDGDLMPDEKPPEFVTLDENLTHELVEIAKDGVDDTEDLASRFDEAIANYLSDTYGWCVNGFEDHSFTLKV